MAAEQALSRAAGLAASVGPRPGIAAGIPASHRDLLDRPLLAALTTLFPDGRPQTQPVWFDHDGQRVLINTMRGFGKERNMRRDPRVTVLVADPGERVHWIEVRGRVRLLDQGAGQHLDRLAHRYTGADRYFGPVVPAELAEREVPVVGVISPQRVVTDLVGDAQVARLTGVRRSRVDPVAPPAGEDVPLPATHTDLLRRPLRAALSTVLPGGHPQTQPVWYSFDGVDVLVHTIAEGRKGRNMLDDPRATILVVDPDDTSRWIEIRGDVAITTTNAVDQLDQVTRRYTGHPRYYSSIRPTARRDVETRIVCRIRPRRVVCDAIHR
jgi:PPOX class probable F420-dependent enzyme